MVHSTCSSHLMSFTTQLMSFNPKVETKRYLFLYKKQTLMSCITKVVTVEYIQHVMQTMVLVSMRWGGARAWGGVILNRFPFYTDHSWRRHFDKDAHRWGEEPEKSMGSWSLAGLRRVHSELHGSGRS